MLDARRAVALLAERGLLDRTEVVNGELRIIEASRRNRNLHVLRRRGPSYMIKQGLGSPRRETIAHEAAVYEYLGSIRRGALVALLPRVVAYLPDECLLVTELVREGESLERHHARVRRFSPRYARRLARALTVVHLATLSGQSEVDCLRCLRRRGMPGSLSALHRPFLTMSGGISNGSMLAIRMIQNIDRYPELIDAAAREWTPACLIHGDLRFDNCVLDPARSSRQGPGLTLVDWELALWGDPCWDAGAVLAGYFASWLMACPISGETPPEKVIHLGRYRFADMQRAAGAFWVTYRDGMTSAREVSLRRTMQFGAVHLLESIIEQLQPSIMLTGRAVCLAQLALNLLEHPEEAADHFLATEIER